MRTNVDIDEDLIARVMSLYRLRSKREAVDLALRRLATETPTKEDLLAARGAGWEGDINKMRESRSLPGR